MNRTDERYLTLLNLKDHYKTYIQRHIKELDKIESLYYQEKLLDKLIQGYVSLALILENKYIYHYSPKNNLFYSEIQKVVNELREVKLFIELFEKTTPFDELNVNSATEVKKLILEANDILKKI